MFDKGLRFLEQLRAFRGLLPSFEVLGGVGADDGRPEAILFGGWLEIQPAVAGVFRLRPFKQIGIVSVEAE